jgi:hypothetical protein
MKNSFIQKTQMSHPVICLYIRVWETDLKCRLNYHPLLLRFQMASHRRFGESQDSIQNYVVKVYFSTINCTRLFTQFRLIRSILPSWKRVLKYPNTKKSEVISCILTKLYEFTAIISKEITCVGTM